MKKLLLVIILLLCSQIVFNSGVLARIANVDDKAICEKTKGNWQFFNNNCADLCDNKFDALTCTSISIFACDCGNNRCWDGNKCVADKVAKITWLEKTKDVREKRQAELEEIKLKALTQSQQNPSNSGPNQSLAANVAPSPAPTPTPAQDPALATPITPDPAAAINAPAEIVPAPVLDPEVERQNIERKEICEKQSGTWKEFKNGCADNCGSKIAKIAMCTMSLTFGCECSGSKCWDSNKNVCIELEEYKTLLTGSKTESLPASLPPSEIKPLPTSTQ